MVSNRPELLYLSHCVPNPPDKGEKIRAYHELIRLQRRYRVHLCCFAKNDREVADAEALRASCASVFVHRLSPADKPLALLRFAFGACLDTAYYDSRGMRRHIRELVQKRPIAATVIYSSVMMTYVPDDIPLVCDLVDVDSEKWRQYAALRKPSFFFALEGRRMRELEKRIGARAACTLLTTAPELGLFRQIALDAPSEVMENGVDFDYFVPQPSAPAAPSVVFVGAMDYFPNADAACWFASNVFPALRDAVPDVRFVVVGRNPAPQVRALAAIPGVTVEGAVPDVRPFVASARFCVTPLRIARGIQNKVLEALAMDKPVLVSPAVAATFGSRIPAGVLPCESAADYVRTFLQPPSFQPGAIRTAAFERFTWSNNVSILEAEIDRAIVSAEDLKHAQL